MTTVKTSVINKDVDSLVDTTSDQTLTTKTLTAPKIDEILDSNGNEEVEFITITAAVNNVQITNAATGNAPLLNVAGGDENIDLTLGGKGTGKVKIGTDEVATLTATQIMSNKTITLTADPTEAMHSVTKQYADSLINGLKWKKSVRCATTAAVTIADDLDIGDVIDGVTLVEGDRVLVKDQSVPNKEQNGIYRVTTGATAVRDDDANAALELVAATMMVEQGTANADTTWICTNNQGFTLDTDDITFVQMAGSSPAHGLTSASHTVSGLTAGMFLRASAADAFGFSTLILPNAATQYDIAYVSATNTIGFIAGAASGVLVTDGSKVPSISTTLPAVTLTTPTIASFVNAGHSHGDAAGGGTLTPGTCLASAVLIAKGGTGVTSFTAGDIPYYNTGTGMSVIAEDTATAPFKFLRAVGNGANHAPVWTALDLSNTALTSAAALPTSRGGTGLTGYVAGDIVYASDTNVLGVITKGSNNTVLSINGSGTIGWTAPASGGMSWEEKTAAATSAANKGYICNHADTRVVITLHASPTLGDVVRVTGKGAAGWRMLANTSQVIHFGNTDTKSAGYIESTLVRDTIEVVCVVAGASAEWNVLSSLGNLTVETA